VPLSLIPFGALEEHGPHLPLSTDTIQAYQVGKRAAALMPLFVAPPIPTAIAVQPTAIPARFPFQPLRYEAW